MIEKYMEIAIVINILILLFLIILMRRWRKLHGEISEKSFAIILTTYFCFTIIDVLFPLFFEDFFTTAIVLLIFLVMFWTIGYQWIKWLYKKIVLKNERDS